MCQHSGLYVFKNGQPGKYIDSLERAAQTQTADLVGVQAGNIDIIKNNLPFVHRQVTRDQVEECGFPRPIGTDDGAQFPFFDGKIDPGYGHESIKGLYKVIHLENHLDGLHLLI
jgi:hypothetical protein